MPRHRTVLSIFERRSKVPAPVDAEQLFRASRAGCGVRGGVCRLASNPDPPSHTRSNLRVVNSSTPVNGLVPGLNSSALLADPVSTIPEVDPSCARLAQHSALSILFDVY